MMLLSNGVSVKKAAYPSSCDLIHLSAYPMMPE